MGPERAAASTVPWPLMKIPNKEMRMRTRVTPVLVAAVVVLLALVLLVASYLGGWWLFADRTRREGEIRRQTFEFQQGSVDAAQQKAVEVRRIDVQLGADPGNQALIDQRTAIVDQTCQLIARVNGDLPSDLDTFKAKECK